MSSCAQDGITLVGLYEGRNTDLSRWGEAHGLSMARQEDGYTRPADIW
jgi:hypothetical protein